MNVLCRSLNYRNAAKKQKNKNIVVLTGIERGLTHAEVFPAGKKPT